MGSFCAYCGKPLIPEARFCVGCGKPVYKVEAFDGQQEVNFGTMSQPSSPTPNNQQPFNQNVQANQFQQFPSYGNQSIQQFPNQPMQQFQNHPMPHYAGVAPMTIVANPRLNAQNMPYVPNEITFVGIFFNYFFGGFSGRCSRKEWWITALVISFFEMVIMTGIVYASYTFFRNSIGFQTVQIYGSYLLMFVNFLPGLMLNSRRLHDLDRSGWQQLIYFIPLIGWIYALIVAFSAGTEGHNRFG